jgi:hypothetical protein
VFSYGHAAFYGSLAEMKLSAPVVDMAPTPASDGYWLASRDGGVFAFGSAPFLGSAVHLDLRSPVIAMASMANDLGYWLVEEQGRVHAFGAAPAHYNGIVPIEGGVVDIVGSL